MLRTLRLLSVVHPTAAALAALATRLRGLCISQAGGCASFATAKVEMPSLPSGGRCSRSAMDSSMRSEGVKRCIYLCS